MSYQRLQNEDNIIVEAFSDSEAIGGSNGIQLLNKQKRFNSSGIKHHDNNYYQHDNHESFDKDEFGESQNLNYKTVRTGRQRKKQAARSKGGEFQTRRKKRRVYFCCVSSEIDIQKLYDYLVGSGGLFSGWKFKLYNDVLHLYKPGTAHPVDNNKSEVDIQNAFLNSPDDEARGLIKDDKQSKYMNSTFYLDNNWKISYPKAQEVFVFDFGAVVFWGLARGEETNLLKTIKIFITKGFVGVHEFQSGEDDMAFVTSNENENDSISVMNEVFTLSDDTPPKQRLSISFAIAQSSVLAIFEARIEKLIEEYKYIPEALASYGKAQLSSRHLGKMIGEVFVIRHDVNLHSEILDTPDFFWKQENYEKDYKMVLNYLEMGTRTEVLNKRLDMLRELLDVLQQQMENAHAVKLEWIVIWLIVVEVVLELLVVWGETNWYFPGRD